MIAPGINLYKVQRFFDTFGHAKSSRLISAWCKIAADAASFHLTKAMLTWGLDDEGHLLVHLHSLQRCCKGRHRAVAQDKFLTTIS